MQHDDAVRYHRTYFSERTTDYLEQVLGGDSSGAGGPFSERCTKWLEAHTGAPGVLLTGSCTHALELAAVLCELGPGDEVIMPSFTFTSTANAVALRGATPVFVDSGDDLNICPDAVRNAISPATRAIMVVHYAGLACDMEAMLGIARENHLWLVEDAAQGLMASYHNRPLGSLADLGAYSFHATKNIACGEGGALVINNPALLERARILHDKGTNRARYRAGQIRQYSWVDLGMSAPPSEFQAAVLMAQLEEANTITRTRRALWESYQSQLIPLASTLWQCPAPASWQQHNGHIYPLIFRDTATRDRARDLLAGKGIQTALHYQPLHLSPAGRKFGRSPGAPRIESLADRLLRLPLWPGMPPDTPARVATLMAELKTRC